MHCKGLSPIESLYTEKNKNKQVRSDQGGSRNIVFCTITNKYSQVTFVSDEKNHFGAHKGQTNLKIM